MRKSPAATKTYYSITEVAGITKVKPHVLRYWESEFPTLRPKKNRAGNRTYQTNDIRQVILIKRLLYDEGYTIAGARTRLGKRDPADTAQIEITFQEVRRDEVLLALRHDLEVLRDSLSEPERE
ncbi:MAG: MerR family transcriptional regulator [bacterium]